MASLPQRPTAQTNIGSVLKSSERHYWKNSLLFQYDKNSDANLFTKPLPVSSLPPDTPVFCSVIQPGIKPTEMTDVWQFIACHCANGAGMQKGVDYIDEAYAPLATACSIPIVVALTSGHNMTIGITDVKNAFENTMLPVSEQGHLSLLPYYLQWFRCQYPNVTKIAPLASESDKYCLQSINAIQGTKPAVVINGTNF
jgi:hypothetical protein